MKLAVLVIKVWPVDMQRNQIPLLSHLCVCKRLLFFCCLNVSFSFPKRVVFFNEVNVICTTEILFQSHLARPQCRCSLGWQDCANLFICTKYCSIWVSGCVYVHTCKCMYVCMCEHKIVSLPAGAREYFICGTLLVMVD
jgi:hypothetical protein